MIEINKRKLEGPIPGLAMRRTDNGIPVIWLHYKADPSMDGERLKRERSRYNSKAAWDQEMEISYEAKSGALVYPEFDRSVHVIEHEEIPKEGCLYMSIDPHPRTPHAALWVLVDRWSDWYVYRELWPSDMYGSSKRLRDSDEDNFYTIKTYAETYAWLEGNSIDIRNPGTDKEWAKFIQKPNGEKVRIRFMDQAGKAFRASAESALLESYAKRYARYGIRCSDPKKAVETGEDAIRALLTPRKHDTKGKWPRLHISNRCLELVYEFENHRYKVMKSEDPERDLQQRTAEVRSHQLDNLRYLATAASIRYSSGATGRRYDGPN